MRPARPLALSALLLCAVLGTAACGGSAVPSSGVTVSTGASAVASEAATLDASMQPVPSGSAVASPLGASADPSTPAATPKATPKPTVRPTARPSAAPTGYQCANLLTNAELRKATGLADARLVNGRNGTPQMAGQTYCPYAASSGTVTVVLAIWTGSAIPSFNTFWSSISAYSSPVSGIGSAAIIDAGDGAGGAKVGKTGISVQIKGPSGVPAGVDALTSITTILKLVAGRV